MKNEKRNNIRQIRLSQALISAACLAAAVMYFQTGWLRTTAAQAPIIATGSVIYRSDDRGQSWTAVGSLPNVVELIADPGVSGVVYARSRLGLYKSGDGGAVWTRIGNGLPAGLTDRLIFDPQNSSTLYTSASVSAASAEIFKSTDGGSNWSRTAKTDFQASITVAPSQPSVIYAISPDGMRKSTDGGANWVRISRPAYSAHGSTYFFPIHEVEVTRTDSEMLYMSGSPTPVGPGPIFRSRNGGVNWDWGLSVSNPAVLEVDPLNPLIVYVKSFALIPGPGLYKTLDGGESWDRIDAQTPQLRSITEIAIDPQTPSNLYAPFSDPAANEAIKNGIYKSVNGGADWVALGVRNGLADRRLADVAIDPRNPARLFFVSPTQVSYQIPPGTSAGAGMVTLVRRGEAIAADAINVWSVAPGIFTADSSGGGVAAGVVARVRAGGAQSYEPIARFDPAQNKIVVVPIDLGPESGEVFLVLFGTGWRFRSFEHRRERQRRIPPLELFGGAAGVRRRGSDQLPAPAIAGRQGRRRGICGG